MKYLIVNADDFGASAGVNRGVAEAACSGFLTSASLMVNMPAAADAVAMWRDLPPLSLGLHINFTNEGGPAIVDFNNSSACQSELLAQFDKFRQLAGQLPTHLDAHHNIHRDPRLSRHFQRLAESYRLPLREHSGVRYFSNFYGQWDGVTHPEQIGVQNLAAILRSEISDGCTELSCHPGYRSADFISSYSLERELELQALCDPSIPEVLTECGIELTDYRRWRQAVTAAP